LHVKKLLFLLSCFFRLFIASVFASFAFSTEIATVILDKTDRLKIKGGGLTKN